MLRWNHIVESAVVDLLGDDLTVTDPQVRLIRFGTPALLHHTSLYIALGQSSEILYVGMAERFHTSSATCERLREHLTEPAKRASWKAVVELPLREDLERHQVARHERRLGVLLGRPGGHRSRKSLN